MKRGVVMTEAEKGAVPRESLRILIPLSGADSDTSAIHVAAEMAPRDAEFFLLHARSGPDEERYPDFKRASEAERFERGIESERIFARANAILASRGLISAGQLVMQGDPAEIILRVANRMAAELIVLAAGRPRRVIDHAACSVLVAEPGVTAKLQRPERNMIVGGERYG
jgi:nucleotide-binding universal stress UspA family protein